MVKFVIRKLGRTGDTTVAVTGQELAERLRAEFRNGYSAGLRFGETTRFIGSDLDSVLQTVQAEAARGVEELEVLLIPRVQGG